MTTDKHRQWSEQYGRYIYEDEYGNPMVDRYGPTDEFDLERELNKYLEDLKFERSLLNPKGDIPTDEESRMFAAQQGDLDAIYVALLNEHIECLEFIINNISKGKEGGRPGLDMEIFLQDLKTVLEDLKSVTEKNPHIKITNTRIAEKLKNEHGYKESTKYLAELVSKERNK